MGPNERLAVTRRWSRNADGSVKVWIELDTAERREYAPVINIESARRRRAG